MRTKETQETEEELADKRWQSPKLFKRIGYILHKEPSAYPNMPKHQPCPTCKSKCKRESKTMGGAKYRCLKCGMFLVLGPGRK